MQPLNQPFFTIICLRLALELELFRLPSERKLSRAATRRTSRKKRHVLNVCVDECSCANLVGFHSSIIFRWPAGPTATATRTAAAAVAADHDHRELNSVSINVVRLNPNN